jgi:hypothetical protein
VTDYPITVGERTLANLYAQVTSLLTKGVSVGNVDHIHSVIQTMDLVLYPLSKNNLSYKEIYEKIRIQLNAARKQEHGSAGTAAPMTYRVLAEWFNQLNIIIDDNGLLFSTSTVAQDEYKTDNEDYIEEGNEE